MALAGIGGDPPVRENVPFAVNLLRERLSLPLISYHVYIYRKLIWILNSVDNNRCIRRQKVSIGEISNFETARIRSGNPTPDVFHG